MKFKEKRNEQKDLARLGRFPTSFKALEEAIYMAQKYEAELHTITVEQLPRYAGAMGEVIEEKATADGKFHEFIKKAKEMAENKGLNLTPTSWWGMMQKRFWNL